jgi:hypothetical protein
LGRALVGQLIKIGYMLRITTEPIGNNKGSADRIGKEGSYLYSFRKFADFGLEEKSAGAISVYEQKRLADLGSPEVKSADMDSTLRTEKGRILPIGLSASFWSIRLVGALALALTDSCASGLADWMPTSAS